jgi:hypothetical protein
MQCIHTVETLAIGVAHHLLLLFATVAAAAPRTSAPASRHTEPGPRANHDGDRGRGGEPSSH